MPLNRILLGLLAAPLAVVAIYWYYRAVGWLLVLLGLPDAPEIRQGLAGMTTFVTASIVGVTLLDYVMEKRWWWQRWRNER